MTTCNPLPPREVTWPDWGYTRFTPSHWAVWNDSHKRVLINAGRAYGKDHVSFLRCMKLMFELYAKRTSNPRWKRLGPVVHLGILGPTSTNLTSLWDRFEDLLPEIPGNSQSGQPNLVVRKDYAELLGRNQIQVSFNTAFSGDNIRGGGFDILLVTEAAYVSEHTLRNSVLPLVIRPNYGGYVLLNSTPRGPGHWWDQAIHQARTGTDYWGSWSLHEGTYADNPCLSEDEVVQFLLEKKQNIYRYRQERLGWINVDCPPDSMLRDDDARAFTPEQIDRCIIKPLDGAAPDLPKFSGPYYCGVDLAGQGADKLAVVIVDRQGYVAHIEVHSKTDIEEIVEVMERIQRQWKPYRFSYDAHGSLGAKLQGRLANVSAVPIKYMRQKPELVKHLTQHMIQGSLKIPDPWSYSFTGKWAKQNLSLLLKELRAYRIIDLRKDVQKKPGVVTTEIYQTYSKPLHGSDDVVDALALALWSRPVPRPMGEDLPRYGDLLRF